MRLFNGFPSPLTTGGCGVVLEANSKSPIPLFWNFPIAVNHEKKQQQKNMALRGTQEM